MEVIRGWTHTPFQITDASRVGEVRRFCAHATADWEWSDVDAGRLSLIVTELGTNLVRHASGGELWVALKPALNEVEVLALDRGPGIADVQRSMQDGVSSGSGSPGTGLGALRRMASDFDLYSSPRGTLSLARVRPQGAPRPPLAGRLGAVCVAAPGETECGDAWCAAQDGDRIALLVADGLGHGPDAAAASHAAVEVFAAQPFAPLPPLVQDMHRALQTTRGAALFALQADDGTAMRYAGAGNIIGRLVSGVFDRSMLTQHGTAGVQVRKAEVAQQEWVPHALIAVHSDGIASRWPSQTLIPLLQRDPALLAAALLWEHTRGRDDATVVVLKPGERL